MPGEKRHNIERRTHQEALFDVTGLTDTEKREFERRLRSPVRVIDDNEELEWEERMRQEGRWGRVRCKSWKDV